MTTIAREVPPPPSFSFSSAALTQLARIRQQYLAQTPDDPPVMLGVFWGWPISAAGEKSSEGAPALGYWRQSEFTEAAWSEVTQASGVKLIYAVMPRDRHRFDGRVVDYAPERAFFLR